MRRLFLLGGDDYDLDMKLDDWWLGLAGPQPTVCIIPTAGGDAEHEIDAFQRTFKSVCKNIKVLRLFRRDVEDIDEFLQDVNLVYVFGGNTASLLAVWRAHGVDRALRKAWMRGVVVGGVSAGAICFGSGGTTDSFGSLTTIPGALAFVNVALSPHHEMIGRRPLFEVAIQLGQFPAGYGLESGVGLLFEDDQAVRIVSVRPQARAWWTTREGTQEIVPGRL